MYRFLKVDRSIKKIGRKGLLLMLAGLAWVGVGGAQLLQPRERFSSPGHGTDTILQVLDSPIFSYVWVVCGIIAFMVGAFRDRRVIYNHDAVGFNAMLTPALMTSLFFGWSGAVWIATGGREGQVFSLYSLIVWAFVSLFIMVVAGWPEAYATSPPELESEED